MYIVKLPNAAGSLVTVTATATTLFELITTAAGQPNGIPGRVNGVDIFVESGDVRVLFDGNSPTATEGLLLKQDVFYKFRNVPMTKMRLVRVGGTDVTCSVQVGFSANYELSDDAGGAGSISAVTSNLLVQAGPADQMGGWSAGGSTVLISPWGVFDPYTATDNASAAVDNATGHGLQQDTSAVLGNRASLSRSVNYSSDLKFVYTYRFAMVDTTDIRQWAGLSTSTNGMLDNDSQDNSAGLQYSTNRADANFQFISEGTVQTIVDSGLAVDTDPHIFEMIYLPGVSVNYKIWNSMHTTLEAETTITTNLIAAATGLEITSGIVTLTTAVKSIVQYKGEVLISPQS